MASATLSALIPEFRQYGDTPFLGPDTYARLRNALVEVTAGAVVPPFDNLGNNHYYWMVQALYALAPNALLLQQVQLFKQYATEYTGAPTSDMIDQLKLIIQSATCGAINPPLPEFGQNVTYWLALALQNVCGGSPAVPPVGVLSVISVSTDGFSFISVKIKWVPQSSTIPDTWEIWRQTSLCTFALFVTVPGVQSVYIDADNSCSAAGAAALSQLSYKVRSKLGSTFSAFSNTVTVV
jgi:hypothetical protein